MSKISDSQKKKLRLREFNPVNYLNDESDITAYLKAVREEGDIILMRDAINLVAQARCLIDLSKKTGISLDKLRSELFNAGKPEVKILKKKFWKHLRQILQNRHVKKIVYLPSKLWKLSLLKQKYFRSGFQNLTKMSQNIPKLLVDYGD